MYNLSITIILLSTLVVTKCQSNDGLFVTLSFDDNLIEHYAAGEMLETYGMRGTFYVNSGRLDSTNQYMSVSQTQKLQERGHEIGGHTINHKNLVSSSSSTRIKEVCDDKENLENLGLDLTSFAFPFGADFTGAENVFKRCNYLSARDSGGIQTPTGCNGCPTFVSLPLEEQFAIRSISYRVGTGNQPIIDIINQARQDLKSSNRFGWLIFIFHEIGNYPNNPTSITRENFEKLLQYIKSKKDISVVTTNKLITSTDFKGIYNNNPTDTPDTTDTTDTTTDTTDTTTTDTTDTTTDTTTTDTTDTTITTSPNASPNTGSQDNSTMTVIGIACGSAFLILILIIIGFFIKRYGFLLKRKMNELITPVNSLPCDDIEMDVQNYINNGSQISETIKNPDTISITEQFNLNAIIIN